MYTLYIYICKFLKQIISIQEEELQRLTVGREVAGLLSKFRVPRSLDSSQQRPGHPVSDGG